MGISRGLTLAVVAATVFAGTAMAQTRVACVGNSITEGYGIWDQKKYPDHLQEMLGDNYKVQNFGVSSMTFANKGPGDNMSYWNTDKFKAALEFNPEVVVIELGTNDSKFFTNNCIENGQPRYNYNYGQYEKEQLYRDYEALLDTFMHLTTSPRVIATLQPYSNNCEWGIMDTAIVNQINPIIEEVATRKGVEIIDLHSQFNTPDWFLADSVHPNATGAKELARIIKEGILKMPADTVPEANDSTGTGDSTTAIRGNARGFVGLDAHNFGEQDMRRFDVQGRKLNAKPKRFTPAIRQVKKR
ncbi:D-alanyl-lipoteichoic acid biosynthesis protein DltD [uncultured Fibrobacter sp.]|uniref:D-alanyl-lipoteichoic acid biosynthesis protein DltD n=1 Tax=uncultured Fibrobacter sp. TaxID=261512 RepID=UPI0025D6F115|nr:D-alanyl-lipoteichoic acid biosynthesis protein DltD [uncultured Fibrobacter sp.]